MDIQGIKFPMQDWKIKTTDSNQFNKKKVFFNNYLNEY
jgi:hypothetical protein